MGCLGPLSVLALWVDGALQLSPPEPMLKSVAALRFGSCKVWHPCALGSPIGPLALQTAPGAGRARGGSRRRRQRRREHGERGRG